MAPEPASLQRTIRFGRDFELDPRAYELRRSGRALRLERIPMEVLLLLAEQRGQLVTREQIVERVWGREVFLDTDNSINAAVRKLRQALRDDPERPRVIQTVTGKGYRFIAEVVGPDAALVSSSPSLDSHPSGLEEKPEARSERGDARAPSRRWPVSIGLALVLLAGLAIYLPWSRARTGPTGGRKMLAVLPFENLTGDPAQEYFSDGLTEEMISRLGNLDPRLAVIARTSVMPYKRNPVPLDRVGRELRVDYVLEGSVRREADKVRIAAQLIRMSDRTHIWARQYDRELGSLLAVQREIAQAVADRIELTLAPGNRIDSGRPILLSPEAYEAYDLYLKGRYFWNTRTAEGFERAVEHFQQAAKKDPAYARAYAGLADSWALMSNYSFGVPKELMPKARSAALRALELDDRLAEAHTSLALIREHFDWDWRSAENEFRRAIQLDPNYATAHHWYAELLTFQGRFAEALAESEHARRLDPLSAIIAADHAAILYFARQYDRAIEAFRAVLEKGPTVGRAHMIVWVYAQKGMLVQGLEGVEEWRRHEDGPWTWAAEVWLNGRSGRPVEARRALAKLEQWARDRPLDPMPMFPAAYLGVNENEKALAWLEKSFRERSLVPALKVDPVYDPLREDPRFQELLRRVGLDG